MNSAHALLRLRIPSRTASATWILEGAQQAYYRSRPATCGKYRESAAGSPARAGRSHAFDRLHVGIPTISENCLPTRRLMEWQWPARLPSGRAPKRSEIVVEHYAWDGAAIPAAVGRRTDPRPREYFQRRGNLRCKGSNRPNSVPT